MKNTLQILINRYYNSNSELFYNEIKTHQEQLDIAQSIYDMRKEKGLSQKELSNLIGISESIINDVENSNCEKELMNVFNKTINVLGYNPNK